MYILNQQGNIHLEWLPKKRDVKKDVETPTMLIDDASLRICATNIALLELTAIEQIGSDCKSQECQ